MSELISISTDARNIHRQLLATVSVLALAAATMSSAKAEDKDRPTIWIELGTQLERADGSPQPYLPDFTDDLLGAGLISPASPQRMPRYAIGGEGKVSFAPANSNWVVSAAIRYGRSNGNRHAHQTVVISTPLLTEVLTGQHNVDIIARNDESHAIIDFQAGKDVGLGHLGREGTSRFSFGLRAVQMEARSSVDIKAGPDLEFGFLNFPGLGPLPLTRHSHTYVNAFESRRSFMGLGPAAAWDASAAITGSTEEGGMTVDWGFNGSILFGRQKANTSDHQTTFYTKVKRLIGAYYRIYTLPVQPPSGQHRSHSAVVPNVGGFAGLSYRFPNAKLSLGYRADFFFGAMDGGQDTRHTYSRNFFGPFATISVGLGG